MTSSVAVPPKPRTQPTTIYTTRLQKGGALLDDMRRLVLEWDDAPNCAERLIAANVLSHPSRGRSRDVVMRAFVPRYVESRPPNLWKPLAILESGGWPADHLRPLHFWAAAQSEALLHDFVLDGLTRYQARGYREIGTEEVLYFLGKAPAERFPTGRWSESVSLRVAQGLLSALRDFGLLEGAAKKRITSVYLPVKSFAFLAFLRHAVGVPGRAMLGDTCWRLFFLGEQATERLFLEAHQQKLLSYYAAGSAIRIEFPALGIEEYARELVARSH